MSGQPPLISIIIPTFNSGKTLDKTLRSISDQTFKNFEVLIMDGLSADNTLIIAEEYLSKIESLIIFSDKDDGIYDALNKGIKKAKGKWLYFLGSDDTLFEDTTLEKTAIYLWRGGRDLVYGNVYSTRFNGIYDGEFNCTKLASKNICHQAVFFSKIIFKKIGKFNLKYKAHADWDHNIRCFFNSEIKKLHIDLIIANYADGGYSSIYGDEVFAKDKSLLLLKEGMGKLTNAEWFKHYANASRLSKLEKGYASKIILLKLRVLFKLQKILIK